ncbi:MAG: MATE family efflux transporter [Lawsonibacter sp.]
MFTFIMSVVIGFGQGFQPVVGFNYGAGRLDRVREEREVLHESCTLVLTTAAVIGFLFAPQVIHFFREDPEVIETSGPGLSGSSVSASPGGAVLVFANMLFQSLGCSWRASFLAVCRQGLFFIPLIFPAAQAV